MSQLQFQRMSSVYLNGIALSLQVISWGSDCIVIILNLPLLDFSYDLKAWSEPASSLNV